MLFKNLVFLRALRTEVASALEGLIFNELNKDGIVCANLTLFQPPIVVPAVGGGMFTREDFIGRTIIALTYHYLFLDGDTDKNIPLR